MHLEIPKPTAEKKYRCLFYALGLVLLILFHATFDLSFGDVEIMFGKVLIPDNEMGVYPQSANIAKALWNYTVWRYQGWTSRSVIEMILVIVAALPNWVWHLLDILSVLLVMYCLDEMIQMENIQIKYLLLSLFLLSYPIVIMRSAGWVATTLNYSWVVSAGLYLVLAVWRIDRGERTRFSMLSAFLCGIFALDQEQFCAFFLGIQLTMLVREFVVRGAVKKGLLPFFILNIGELVFILVCPGNRVRNSFATEAFRALSFGRKLYEGCCSLLKGVFGTGGLVLLVFLLAFLTYILFVQKWSLWMRAAAVFCDSYVILRMVGRAPVVREVAYPMGYLLRADFREDFRTALVGAGVLLLICILCARLTCLKGSFLYLWAAWLLAAATKVVLGFTTSVYESGERTSIFCWFTGLVTLLFLVKHYEKACMIFSKRWFRVCIMLGIAVLTGCQFLMLSRADYSF